MPWSMRFHYLYHYFSFQKDKCARQHRMIQRKKRWLPAPRAFDLKTFQELQHFKAWVQTHKWTFMQTHWTHHWYNSWQKTPNKPKPKPQTISFCCSWCRPRARVGRIRWAIHTLKWLRTILMWIRGQADLLWFSVKVKRLKYKELLKCDSIKGVGTAGTESECQRERVHLQSSLNELKDVNLKNLLKY